MDCVCAFLVCDIIAIAYSIIERIFYFKATYPNVYKYEEFYSDGLVITVSIVELLSQLIE